MATSAHRIDQFFVLHASRNDRWQTVAEHAREWRSGGERPSELGSSLEELAAVEQFFAIPGSPTVERLQGLVGSGEAQEAARLAQHISEVLTLGRGSELAEEWESDEDAVAADIVPSVVSPGESKRPYFEVLYVTAQEEPRWKALRSQVRRLRRREDQFVYEPVFVGSMEDAICAAVLNPRLAAVVVAERIPQHSRNDAPVIRELLDQVAEAKLNSHSGLELARALKRIRPELDLYMLSGHNVEAIAGDPQADVLRRVFHSVEEPIELHLSILEGVAARYETPFFDNLKKYAQRPIATFHALPIARGKSVFQSDWIRDMGEFYGMNLFLAESSATTGGLDSLLEPTGTIKKAQEMAARAFGADHVFFVTNGTSTSNKMVVQALVRPGDVVLVDRNCHKSHHYGLVLCGGQPAYVEAFPLTQYSMYGAVPLETIKKTLLDFRDEGRLDRVRMLDLTNCTFDGHMYNTRRVMAECLAIKPDLIFLWDEAWSGFAHWSPFLRPRTAMGAAADLKEYLASPEAAQAYEAQQQSLGPSPSRDALMSARLTPDPRKVRLRVYQTNSTHKSMSAIRQGSMVLVHDVDFPHVQSQFREAVFTHASTSPNQQLIAGLEVARRQMELEGYGLVMNAITIALKIRQEINRHPLISKYFRVLGADAMIPEQFRNSGFVDYLSPGVNWGTVLKAVNEDEFFLDPTRLTMVCGTAGFDGTSFKGLLANRFSIQVNKTSRNSVLLQSNINNSRSDVALLLRVLVQICRELEESGGPSTAGFKQKVHNLMTEVPELPNFSRFHDVFRKDGGPSTTEGDMRTAFFAAYSEENCEYVPLRSAEIDKRLENGPDLVSANFVIPYPPGFPIMVPGQVLTKDAITFMRKLDVKEIHGFEAEKGLKLLRPDRL